MATTRIEVRSLESHRLRTVRATMVQPGDLVEVAGWPAVVRHSEPYSDFIWYIEADGLYRDGDPFTTAIKIPADVNLRIRRATKEN